MPDLTHIGKDGAANMVDVGDKPATVRFARACGTVKMAAETLDLILAGNAKKGDVLATARIAGIMAAKRTHDLIPLCHPIGLDSVSVELEPIAGGIRVVVTTAVTARTGVEMEAMTGAVAGALTLYDMVKGLDRSAEIGPVRLLEKSGGRSGAWRRG